MLLHFIYKRLEREWTDTSEAFVGG